MSTLYYATERVALHLADARDVLSSTPDESADLLLCDPPYGVEWRSGHRTEQFSMLANDAPDDRAGIAEVLAHGVRCLGQNRHLYVFGPSDVLAGLKVTQPVPLVWDKGRPGMGDLASPWGPQHEAIHFAVGLHRHAGDTGTDRLSARLRKGSVIRCTPPTGRQVRHPSEKPTALLRELIESSSKPGELVLDPFAGSGSTGVAALLTGRRALLVELDERWAEMAAERLRLAERFYTEGEQC
jgi:DNA modification methylase